MRGTPIHRTILVWICALSLAFAGCAANRTEVPMEGSGPDIIHALGVIPTGGVPEINVVRMGNSRILGALQGAGRGFLDGAAVIARGAGGMGGCSGEGCAVVAAVMIVLVVSAGTVGAVIGGVKGSRVAAPYEQVSDPDDATRNRLASLRIQEGIARLVEEEARQRLPIPVSLEERPTRDADHLEGILREWKASGVDAALRVGITRVGFEGPVGKDPPVSIVITLRAEIVRTANGAKVLEKTLEHRSAAMPAGDWVKDDFLRLTRELDGGVRELAKRCVNDILDTDLVPVPSRSSTRQDPRLEPER
jgi:hypothetical protein